MIKEKFKEYIELCGGIDKFIECREELMEIVYAIDDVVELEAKIDSVEVSGEEIFKKLTTMVVGMSKMIA